MPSYKGHLVGGTAAFFATHYVATHVFLQPPLLAKEFLFAFAFCLLGSLFPDVDTKSFGQKIFYWLLAVILIAAILSRQWGLLSVLSLIGVFPLLVNHRGIFHRVWFVMLLPLAIPLIIAYNSPQFAQASWLAYLYFVVGALSHLLLDYGIWRFFRFKT